MENIHRGFIVHSYADRRQDRLYLLGRLEDGRSFAVVERRWRPSLLIYENDLQRCPSTLPYSVLPTEIRSFDNREYLLELKFAAYSGRRAAAAALEEAGVRSPDIDNKAQDAFLISRGIRGPVQIQGKAQAGRLVDLVFLDPELSALKEFSPLRVPLRLCSIDIETEVKTGCILAIGFSVSIYGNTGSTEGKQSLVRLLEPGTCSVSSHEGLIFHRDEKSLLQTFLSDIAEADPDVLTGWNFLDFDYPRLAERCSFHRIPFTLGRSPEEAKFFPAASGSVPNDPSWPDRRYSAAALVPGRQVIDALRVVRSGPKKLSGYTLETAAREVLGSGKIIVSSGEKKIEDLEKLYCDDPLMFGEYCKRDAELVLEILEKTGLFRLSLER